MGPDSFFGEESIITGNLQRVTFTAIDTVEVYEISLKGFELLGNVKSKLEKRIERQKMKELSVDKVNRRRLSTFTLLDERKQFNLDNNNNVSTSNENSPLKNNSDFSLNTNSNVNKLPTTQTGATSMFCHVWPFI